MNYHKKCCVYSAGTGIQKFHLKLEKNYAQNSSSANVKILYTKRVS